MQAEHSLLGAGQSVLGSQQDGQSVIWTGTVDLTDDGRITPREEVRLGWFLSNRRHCDSAEMNSRLFQTLKRAQSQR